MANFYVYAYIDPMTNQPFYVGKGKHFRLKAHLRPSLWNSPQKTTNPFLYGKIKSLMIDNTPPIIIKLKEKLTEEKAFQIENEYINKFGRRFGPEGGILFNIIGDKQQATIKPSTIQWSEKRKLDHKQRCKSTRIYDPSYEELFSDYITKNKSRKTIALENNISEILVKKRLSFYGILKPKEHCYPPKKEFTCIQCETKFLKPNSIKNAKYCSRKCLNESKRSRKNIIRSHER